MDVNSGSIHVVDDVVSDIIPLVEELAGKSVKDPVALKEALLRRTDLPYPEEILRKPWKRCWSWRQPDSCLPLISTRIMFMILRRGRQW